MPWYASICRCGRCITTFCTPGIAKSSERNSQVESRQRKSVSYTSRKADGEKGMSSGSLPSAAFYVQEITLKNLPEELDFLYNLLPSYENRNLKLSDIEELVRKLNQKLQDKGYVTSQVVIPEQNLSGEKLVLYCTPGKLGQVVYAKGSENLPWKMLSPSEREI